MTIIVGFRRTLFIQLIGSGLFGGHQSNIQIAWTAALRDITRDIAENAGFVALRTLLGRQFSLHHIIAL
jgi:hypothetical protein